MVATRLPDDDPARTRSRLAARTGTRRPARPPDAIAAAIAAITGLLEGGRTDLSSIACDPGEIDPFFARVYEAARAIPAGETTTYGAIARTLGDKHLAQAVGRALRRNPLPIIVPCHRVLGAGGRLTGFSAAGGVETKRRMLRAEGVWVAGSGDLFDALPLMERPPR